MESFLSASVHLPEMPMSSTISSATSSPSVPSVYSSTTASASLSAPSPNPTATTPSLSTPSPSTTTMPSSSPSSCPQLTPFLSPDLPNVSLSTETSHSSEDYALSVKLMHKGREVASTRRTFTPWRERMRSSGQNYTVRYSVYKVHLLNC